MFVLSIQGYTTATDKPHNASFSFIGDEIRTLLEFIEHTQTVEFRSGGSINIDDEALRRLTLSKRQALSLVTENEELFAEIAANSITKSDVVAIGYRKKQLEVFRRLLEEPDYFAEVKAKKNARGDEAVWQAFFEKNSWIFGYGLSYIYLDNLDDKKLEQVVQGYRVGAFGKRVDALMKSRGIISSLGFVEIKTHTADLLANSTYRAGCWPASVELTGAISQAQGTVAAAMDTLKGKLAMNDEGGDPTGEEAFNYSPKSFLIIGTLKQFLGEHGVNQDKFRSFELLRRNCQSPEIITFDELYERARFIVESAA